MPRKDLTTFLIALNDSIKLRDKYRTRRTKLLQQWGLSEHPARDDATLDVMREAVAAERTAQVDLWILVDQAPERNTEYDPNA